MTRPGRKIALGALLVAVAGTLVALVPVGLAQLAIRRSIAKLSSADTEIALDGLRELAAREGGALRFQREALFDGLEWIEEKPATGMRNGAYESVRQILAGLGALDPSLLDAARRHPALARAAFGARLWLGRPDLACPAPIETTLTKPGECSVELSTGELSVDVEPFVAPLVFSPLAEGDQLYLVTDRGELARLGPGDPTLATKPPPPGDPRWERPSSMPGAAIARGETYAAHLAARDLDLTALIHVLDHDPGRSVRLRWRVVEAHRVEPAR